MLMPAKGYTPSFVKNGCSDLEKYFVAPHEMIANGRCRSVEIDIDTAAKCHAPAQHERVASATSLITASICVCTNGGRAMAQAIAFSSLTSSRMGMPPKPTRLTLAATLAAPLGIHSDTK